MQWLLKLFVILNDQRKFYLRKSTWNTTTIYAKLHEIRKRSTQNYDLLHFYLLKLYWTKLNKLEIDKIIHE